MYKQSKAESKKQQRFFGMVHAVQKGDLSPSEVGPAVRKAAKNTEYSDAKDFASTKHKNLPEKKGSLQMRYFEKISYDVKTAPKKELEEYLEATPTKPMLGGALVGAVYGIATKKPKLRYSMLGGAAAFGTLDAIRKNLSYEELKKRKK